MCIQWVYNGSVVRSLVHVEVEKILIVVVVNTFMMVCGLLLNNVNSKT